MKRINDYANSMFRYEHLTDTWIEKCSAYIRSLFGEQLQGKTVVDYAFGRGNWSLALLDAGAESVIAIDASEDNVRRFSEYCASKGLSKINVLQGNLLDKNLDIEADFFWVYGILHHLENPDLFLQRLSSLKRGAQAWYYLYAYNANSLRHFVVESCRQLIIYRSETHYLSNMPYYIDAARKRVRDDLVAPHIKWYHKEDLTKLCEKHNFKVVQQDRDFSHYLGTADSEEFCPYQLLVTDGDNTTEGQEITVPPVVEELGILETLFSDVRKYYTDRSEGEKEILAVGLSNTYYSSLGNNKVVVVELFLYLANILLTYNIETSKTSHKYLALVKLSLQGAERKTAYKTLGHNRITRFLVDTKIRL